jgi:hypothetical protein
MIMDTEELIRQKAVEKLAGMEQFWKAIKPNMGTAASSAVGATGGAIMGALQQLSRPKEERNYIGGAMTGALGGGMMGAGLNIAGRNLNYKPIDSIATNGMMGGLAGSFTGHLAPTPKQMNQVQLNEALELEAFLNTPDADYYYSPQDKQALLQYIEQIKQGA